MQRGDVALTCGSLESSESPEAMANGVFAWRRETRQRRSYLVRISYQHTRPRRSNPCAAMIPGHCKTTRALDGYFNNTV